MGLDAAGTVPRQEHDRGDRSPRRTNACPPGLRRHQRRSLPSVWKTELPGVTRATAAPQLGVLWQRDSGIQKEGYLGVRYYLERDLQKHRPLES